MSRKNFLLKYLQTQVKKSNKNFALLESKIEEVKTKKHKQETNA